MPLFATAETHKNPASLVLYEISTGLETALARR
jgi:hypothetical protein